MTAWTAAHWASQSFTISWSQTYVHWAGEAIQSSPVLPFSSCPQSFPASGSSPMSQLFASGGQSIGASASASVLPMNIQGWFPLRLTGFISLESEGLSRVFCSTTVGKHQFFGTQPFLWSSSHIRRFELLQWLSGKETAYSAGVAGDASWTSLLDGLALTSVHDYWKNHGFYYTNLCQQSDVSAL